MSKDNLDSHHSLETKKQPLKDSEARIRAILETAVDAIITIDEKGTIESVNPAAVRLFGYAAGEMVGRNVKMLMPDPYRREHDEYITNYRKTGRKKIIGIGREVIGLRKDGTTFPMDLAVSEVNLEDRQIFTGIVRDITERKKLEEDLAAAAAQAKAANEAKSEFLANMSHELRTPLGVVVGIADILVRRKSLEGKEQELLSTLQIGAGTLEALINDLLDISQIESKKIQLNSLPFRINEIIAEMGSFFTMKAREKGLDFEFRLAEEDLAVIGDPVRISQIITNLVNNAIKYTERGKIVLCAQVTRHEYADYRKIKVIVEDTGIGIPSPLLGRVFERFGRGDNAHKTGGVGLGLAISKNLAEMMGGSIEVKSEVGEGSEFSLSLVLPLADENSLEDFTEESSEKREEEKSNDAPLVLLVDDHQANLLVAKTMVEDMGFLCVTAENGKRALDKIDTMREELYAVIMDLRMPVMDGLEATVKLRRQEKEKGYRHLPIIALTAHALKGDRERCLEAGMDAYLSKPFDRERLEKILKEELVAA